MVEAKDATQPWSAQVRLNQASTGMLGQGGREIERNGRFTFARRGRNREHDLGRVTGSRQHDGGVERSDRFRLGGVRSFQKVPGLRIDLLFLAVSEKPARARGKAPAPVAVARDVYGEQGQGGEARALLDVVRGADGVVELFDDEGQHDAAQEASDKTQRDVQKAVGSGGRVKNPGVVHYADVARLEAGRNPCLLQAREQEIVKFGVGDGFVLEDPVVDHLFVQIPDNALHVVHRLSHHLLSFQRALESGF